MLRFKALFCLLLLPFIAQANTVESLLPNAKMKGTATFGFAGFPLYQARLFTSNGAALDWNKDFALELKYLRNVSKKDLVESSMREFARLGSFLPVQDQLQVCFDDVRKGDRYTAMSQGQDKVIFWLNEKRTCTLEHPEIKLRFMRIFLGDNTRSKSFTRKLKGE